ncbi:CoA transferase [Rhodococcus globerulus]|uniref:CaiB/BaiF CoA transferase family protein n=1 Tax=Rhodococcus globerulus TaxID=33008 RepID=UPI00301A6D5B
MPTRHDPTASTAPLTDLVVVDLSTTFPGAQASQFLADCGADVVIVERPGGSQLRNLAAWPALLRGKRSVTADLHTPEGMATLHRLLERADVLITTMRPTTAEAIGLTTEILTEKYPRLVAASITGWGSTGPWKDYKGWEALVMAKTGNMHAKSHLTKRNGPAYISTPFASFGAGQAAVHGILAALIERESSGLGQVVESDLVRGMGSMDTYNWFYEMILQRYPDAFTPMDNAYDDQDRPQAYLVYALLIAPTKDGHWLQFAQVSARLTHAWLKELDLLAELADPKWKDFPMFETAELRLEFWELMQTRVSARTLAEWEEVFATNHDISAEQFRTPEQGLAHPQVVHDGRVMIIDDPELGPVRQPSTLVHSAGGTLSTPKPAPRAGEHTAEILAQLTVAAELTSQSSTRDSNTRPLVGNDARTLPLDGITVVEFGTMFAGPYGATLLTDLGARVIKIEPLEGDSIRQLVAFPEAGGAKVLQGKESVAIDLTDPEGLAIIYEIVKKSDIVLECFRGGAAARTKIDETTLKSLNPELVYLSAPGYGSDGPYSQRPAYAPSVGAASGLAATDSRNSATPVKSPLDLRRKAAALHIASATPAIQADGIAALGVASAMLLGLYAKRRNVEIPGMITTMLGTATHALAPFNTSYDGRPDLPITDCEFYGLSALYRMYAATDGWVFLAAPLDSEWETLADALADHLDLASDPRFSTSTTRRDNDDTLAEVLAKVFITRGKQDWEHDLTAMDVGCVAVCERNSELELQTDPYFDAGYSVEAVSPIFDEHRRLSPLNRFSRSRTKADAGCTVGQHTRSVLTEVGVSAELIEDLLERNVIVCDN